MPHIVMAGGSLAPGLDPEVIPAIHALLVRREDVDARLSPGMTRILIPALESCRMIRALPFVEGAL
jgi:hypothetical protein